VRPISSRRALFLVTFLVTAALGFLPTAAHACTGNVTVTPAGPADRLPAEGPAPGTPLTVSGSAFAAGPVVVHWGSVEGPVLGRAVADRNGEFTSGVVVPQEVGDRPRILVRSVGSSANGMPSTGWADLGDTTAPVAAAPTGESDPVGSSPAPLPVGLVVLAVLVVLVGAAGLGATTLVLRRRARTARTEQYAVTDDDLEQELREVIRAEGSPTGSASR
jgi:hypothetical protein